jgi:hypothetical protein
MDEETLREEIYDAIAAGRSSLRVAYEQPKPETGATFSVKFVLTVDEKVRQALHDKHLKDDCSVPMLVKNYIRECFEECIEDDVVGLKEAA